MRNKQQHKKKYSLLPDMILFLELYLYTVERRGNRKLPHHIYYSIGFINTILRDGTYTGRDRERLELDKIGWMEFIMDNGMNDEVPFDVDHKHVMDKMLDICVDSKPYWSRITSLINDMKARKTYTPLDIIQIVGFIPDDIYIAPTSLLKDGAFKIGNNYIYLK